MRRTVILECATPRSSVFLHAWDSAGYIEHQPGVEIDGSGRARYRFELDVPTPDCREVRFKFFYPGSGDTPAQWEVPDYERRLPAGDGTVWCFEFSARCLTSDPDGPAPLEITFHVCTQKFGGGTLFAWRPGTDAREWFSNKGQDGDGYWLFRAPVRDWMRRGFHFKLVTAQGRYEAEWLNRVWRSPAGAESWLKAGQLELRSRRIQMVNVTLGLAYPRSLQAAPRLLIDDDNDSYTLEAGLDVPDLPPSRGEVHDEWIAAGTLATSVYPDAPYHVKVLLDGNVCQEMALQVPQSGDAGSQKWLLLGHWAWLADRPRRSGHAILHVEPNPSTGFSGPLVAEWGIGSDGRGRHNTYGQITALSRHSWDGALGVVPGLPHWVGMLRTQDGTLTESRADGPVASKRTFVGRDGISLRTIDGVTGLVVDQPLGAIEDVSSDERKRLMKAVFDPPIVDAGVFAAHEMPHGATVVGDKVWFVLYAPHAVKARVMLLRNGEHPRTVETVEMKLTPDLRYWWTAVETTQCPAGQRYRYLLNDDQEVVDPAAQLFSGTEYRLWAFPNDDGSGPWSVVVDRKTLTAPFQGSEWRTPPWQHLVIYELHSLRLTRAHLDSTGQPLPAFEQLIRELQPGGYLHDLRVTALELLPPFEFSARFGWGYSANSIRPIESSFGGGNKLAAFVRASHDAGKAVLLDVVFNHLAESALQAVADSEYCDGATKWGAMVNYDHPAVKELYRQVLVYLWDTFQLDGFRFDATKAIVRGNEQDEHIIDNYRIGSGGGWEFLKDLRTALQSAANACGRPWPYPVAENDPNQWDMNGPAGVLEGQWNFALSYPLGEAAINDQDKAEHLSQVMSARRAMHEMVNYACSHDSVSKQEDWKKRMVAREKWGNGMRMAKAISGMVILSKGLPMMFAGQCAGEHIPFHFGMDAIDQEDRYARLALYRTSGTPQHQVYKWFQDLLGLRLDPSASLNANDEQWMGWGRKTLACHRLGGRYVIIGTFGTQDTRQTLSWLKLHGDYRYKEIFNSSWEHYRVDGEWLYSNGGYDANLGADDQLTLPPVGAIVLERR